MSRNTGNKSGGARKGGGSSPLLTGILVGMVIGVAMAAGLAWFIMKSPSPFVQNEQVTVKPAVAAKPQAQPIAVVPGGVHSAQSAVAPASGVSGDKPRFEFYKVLTDKQDASVAPAAKPADKPLPESKPVAVSGPQFLQAGSFSNAADAEKVKAKLAMMGVEASIQTATIPEKGVWHRVRLGPYKSADEMNKVRATLKQNGIDATPIRAQ
jgi:cell division protein FtsN